MALTRRVQTIFCSWVVLLRAGMLKEGVPPPAALPLLLLPPPPTSACPPLSLFTRRPTPHFAAPAARDVRGTGVVTRDALDKAHTCGATGMAPGVNTSGRRQAS